MSGTSQVILCEATVSATVLSFAGYSTAAWLQDIPLAELPLGDKVWGGGRGGRRAGGGRVLPLGVRYGGEGRRAGGHEGGREAGGDCPWGMRYGGEGGRVLPLGVRYGGEGRRARGRAGGGRGLPLGDEVWGGGQEGRRRAGGREGIVGGVGSRKGGHMGGRCVDVAIDWGLQMVLPLARAWLILKT